MTRKPVLIAACIALGLAACAPTVQPDPEPRIITVEVAVPVPVKCEPQLGPEPDYPDTDAALRAAPGLYERTQLIVAGRLMRIARLVEYQAAMAECRG